LAIRLQVPVNSWPVPGPWSSAHSTSQQTKHTVENGGKNAEQKEKMGRKNLRKKAESFRRRPAPWSSCAQVRSY